MILAYCREGCHARKSASGYPVSFWGCASWRGCGRPEYVEGPALGLSKSLSVAGWLRHPGARPSARSQHRAILAPGCARKPGGRTPVQSARRVPRLAARIARQLAFLRKPMAAHGVPLLRRGVDGALRRCKGCARSGRHAECPVEMDAARRSRPGGWTGVRRRGMRTMGCAISTGRRGAAAGARFQIGNTHRQKPRAPCDPRN